MKKILVLLTLVCSVGAQAAGSLLDRDLKLKKETLLTDLVKLSPDLCRSYSRKVEFPEGSDPTICYSATKSFEIKNAEGRSVGKCRLAVQPAFDKVLLTKGLVLHFEDSFGTVNEDGKPVDLIVINTTPAITKAALYMLCDEKLNAEDVTRSMDLK